MRIGGQFDIKTGKRRLSLFTPCIVYQSPRQEHTPGQRTLSFNATTRFHINTGIYMNYVSVSLLGFGFTFMHEKWGR
jgi:hypothetical protein